MWFIGLDWADEHHDICVITDVGKQIGSLRIAHTPEGFRPVKLQDLPLLLAKPPSLGSLVGLAMVLPADRSDHLSQFAFLVPLPTQGPFTRDGHRTRVIR